jgi:ribonuclease HI
MLNMDGACKDKGEITGCGGLTQDSDGRWIKGFARKIEACDALHAEMWDLYIGLDMTQWENISHFFVKSDSKILLDMNSNIFKFNRNIQILVHGIRN